MYSIWMFSEKKARVFELMPDDHSAFHVKTSVVALLAGERLVAAKVDTAASVCRMWLVVYEAI